MKKTKLACLQVLLLLYIAIPLKVNSQPPGGKLFDPSILHEIRIEFSEPNYWQILLDNFGEFSWKSEVFSKGKASSPKEFYQTLKELGVSLDDEKVPYLSATVTIDGERIEQVGVRFKGYSSYFSAPEFKKSLKLDFNEFVSGQGYAGVKKLNLNNGVGDPSLQRDALAYSLMRKAGVAAPRTSYARVYMNGEYMGLFLVVEQIDKSFLEYNFASGKGDLYKNIGWSELNFISNNFSDYAESIELKTNRDTSNGEGFVRLVEYIDRYNRDKFYDSIQQVLNVDYFLKVLAIDIISKNWDSFMEHGRNFYLYHEPVSGLFYWIPWDYNFSFGGSFGMNWNTNSNDTILDFTYKINGNKINLYCTKPITDFYNVDWDFGDGSYEEIPEHMKATPTHTYSTEGIYTVSLYAYTEDWEIVSVSKRISLIDTAGLCPTALTMSRAYIPDNDYQRVYQADSSCCNCRWDIFCDNILNGNWGDSHDDYSYPIISTSNRTLIDKIFRVDAFKKRYLDIFKYIIDSVFIEKDIYDQIVSNTDLIRDAVYEDPYYAFTLEEFENDIFSCSSKLDNEIPNIPRFVTIRRNGLIREYQRLGHAPQPLEATVGSKDIVINELFTNGFNDEGEPLDDWIELYNTTDRIVHFDNFYLSDKYESPELWRFTKRAAIRPNGYLIVWASGKTKKNNLHTPFRLSSQGEQLMLSHKLFGVIDSISFGAQQPNMSFARIPNGTGPFVEGQPTFNAFNVEEEVKSVKLIGSDSGFNVFPNPASSQITIEASTPNVPYSISLYNSFGQKLIHREKCSGTTQLDIQALQEGLHIVRINYGGQSISFKVIVRR